MGEVEAGGSLRLACTHMHCTVHYIGKLSCSIELTEKWALEAGLCLQLHFKPKRVCLSVVQGPLSGGSFSGKNDISPRAKPLCLWEQLASRLFSADVPILAPWYKSAWSGEESPKFSHGKLSHGKKPYWELQPTDSPCSVGLSHCCECLLRHVIFVCCYLFSPEGTLRTLTQDSFYWECQWP